MSDTISRRDGPGPVGVHQRQALLIRESFDREARTVNATLSTERPVDRVFGKEVLEHTKRSIDLSEVADSGMALLVLHGDDPNHGGYPVGRVENIRLSDRKLKGTLRFGRGQRAAEVMQDVEDRILIHVSLGYKVSKWQESRDQVTATRWRPVEASVVAMPADAGASIARELPTMSEEIENVVNIREEVMAEERQRTRKITDLITRYTPQLRARNIAVDKFMADNLVRDLEDVRNALLEALGQETQPAAKPVVQSGDTEQEKFLRELRQAIAHRGNVLSSEERKSCEQDNALMGWSMREMAREYLRVGGHSPRGDYRHVVGQALTRAIVGHGTSDFTAVLRDTAGKNAQVGFEEAEETWQAWCGTTSINDFKQNYLPQLATFGDLDVVPEGGEYKYGTFTDFEELIKLKTYGKLFSITRQAIINDDQRMFTIPRRMGRAAARMVGDEAYGVLTTNAALNQDSTALFHADHNNLVGPGSGAAPSIATLNAAFASFGTQTDPSGNVLNLTPRYLMAPKALEGTVRTLLAAQFDPAIASGRAPNPWQGRLDGVYEARLDADDAAQWYLAASPSMVGTVTVGFLNGVQTPFLEEETTLTVDGIVYKVRMDVAAAAADYRGLYQNDGN